MANRAKKMDFNDIEIAVCKTVYKKIKNIKTGKNVRISSLKDKIKKEINLDVDEMPQAKIQKTIVGTWVNEASESNIAPIMLVKDEGPFSVEDFTDMEKKIENLLKKQEQKFFEKFETQEQTFFKKFETQEQTFFEKFETQEQEIKDLEQKIETHVQQLNLQGETIEFCLHQLKPMLYRRVIDSLQFTNESDISLKNYLSRIIHTKPTDIEYDLAIKLAQNEDPSNWPECPFTKEDFKNSVKRNLDNTS